MNKNNERCSPVRNSARCSPISSGGCATRLLSRILAAVDAWASRPWYARAWFTWPLGWQAASVVLVAIALYATWVAPPLPASVVATGNAGGVIWRALIEPLMGYVVGLVVLMGIACAVFGAALNYLFLERTASR